MTLNLPRDNEVDLVATLPWDNKSSCEREVTLAAGQSLPQGSSLSWVHVNRPKTLRQRVPTNPEIVIVSSGKGFKLVGLSKTRKTVHVNVQLFTCDCNAISRNYCTAAARKNLIV